MQKIEEKSIPELPANVKQVLKDTLDSAQDIHNHFGAGLIQEVYEDCLFHDMFKRGHTVETHWNVPVYYDGLEIRTDINVDLIIDACLMIIVLSEKDILPIHRESMKTYLRITGVRAGLIINFYEPELKKGICEIII